MTSTLDDLALAEMDFERPCQNFRKCSNQATWMGWSTHGASQCPASCYVCDKCKKLVEALWEKDLRVGRPCGRCKVKVTGQISDHLRFIKL